MCFVRYKWFEAIIIIIMDFVPRDSFPFKSFLHKILSTQNPKGHLKRVVWIGGCNKSYVFNSQTVNQSCIIFISIIIYLYTISSVYQVSCFDYLVAFFGGVEYNFGVAVSISTR